MTAIRKDWEKFRRDLVNERGKRPRADVCAELGIKEPTLCRYENGSRVPGVEVYETLCRWMKVETQRYNLPNDKNN